MATLLKMLPHVSSAYGRHMRLLEEKHLRTRTSQCFLQLIALVRQECPILLLEVTCPAEFRFKPHQTHLNQLVKVFGVTRNLQAGVLGWWYTGQLFEQCCLGTFPLRMGNTFLFGYFRSVVGPVSHLVARWWQHFPKLPSNIVQKVAPCIISLRAGCS